MFGTQTFSGTYSYAPTGSEIIVAAYQRIQIRPAELLTYHLQQATMEMNLLLQRFNNLAPNLWAVTLQALPLVQAQASYSLPAETVMVLDMYIRTGTGTSTNDRMIFPISRTEYAATPNKLTQAFPNQFWFDRLISPTITFYPTPDGNGPYTAYYYQLRSVQDAIATNGLNVEVPARFLDALIAGLAHRLARVFAPALEQIRKMDADEAWQIAASQDQENVPMMISPSLSGYWR